jgi:PiT family inorganic phosphate transporter
VEVVPASDPAVAIQRAEQLTVSVGESVTCRNQYHGRVLGVQAGPLVDRLHLVSAGLVSFSRGLNDTPKIAALFLLAPQLGGFTSTALVGVFMAAGGVLSARKVAETMSQKITPMNHGQGFSANLITGLIVIAASGHGLPVSTTHVSCGSLFGIGAITGQGRLRMIATILTAWVTTLPVAAILGAVSYGLVTRF